jgi:hypothetical protein
MMVLIETPEGQIFGVMYVTLEVIAVTLFVMEMLLKTVCSGFCPGPPGALKHPQRSHSESLYSLWRCCMGVLGA